MNGKYADLSGYRLCMYIRVGEVWKYETVRRKRDIAD